ncbi:hypothetical protein RF11_15225 [Thelohanellus kitauei]|uniref:Beta-soluble NSF attachment protein n=1 Tax=Thelohanellus kitauei TaxID=669202 RepID=A0A0C2NFF9_THEKT|nr:hypothetical protein RF11_15225 [Thelohanellus kitauei]
MENLDCNKNEHMGTSVSMEDNYDEVFKTACKIRREERFEAGSAFIKAAELAHSSSLEYKKVVGRYEDAADCFLQITDDRALTCYMIAADIFVKNEMIEQGIECFVRWGYESGQKLGDMNRAERFFQNADDLRSEHKLSHTCVITEFEKSDLGSDDVQALEKAEEILEQLCADIV